MLATDMHQHKAGLHVCANAMFNMSSAAADWNLDLR
jgi:hypothetical protein